ncbi:unnamed protein product [Amoebophrya sp. A25]|nr:unnamed protein product [Amoebophrya sp. A25]|eukprot:GSA25T00025986001.1
MQPQAALDFLQAIVASDRDEGAMTLLRERIGRIGESLAASYFEDSGYRVVWVNQDGETRLPFDLVLTPQQTSEVAAASTSTSQSELESLLVDHGKKATSSKKATSKKTSRNDPHQDDSHKKIVAATSKNSIFVEVKTSIRREKTAFEVSPQEVITAMELGNRYWFCRVEDLSAEFHTIHTLNTALADMHRTGEGRLFLVA